MREAHESGHAILPSGGGTLQGIGNAPARCDVVMETRHLTRIHEYRPQDLTIGVEAGLTLRSLSAILAEQGQFLPLDAPLARRATVGGTLAAGWAGPRRHRYGRPRDFLIGCTVALADGTIATTGGMVVKNVSGYDLGKLYVGSLGTLGIIARANFKTFTLPQISRLAIAALPENTRDRVVAQLNNLPIEPAAAIHVHGFRTNLSGATGEDGRLFVLLDGSTAAVDRATRDLRSALGTAGVPNATIVDAGALTAFGSLLDTAIANTGSRSVTFRSFGSGALQFADRVQSLARASRLRAETITDVINEDCCVRVSAREPLTISGALEAFDEHLRALDPQRMVIAGNKELRAQLDAWGAAGQGFPYMRALKERFDPQRILNPGRYLGGL